MLLKASPDEVRPILRKFPYYKKRNMVVGLISYFCPPVQRNKLYKVCTPREDIWGPP